MLTDSGRARLLQTIVHRQARTRQERDLCLPLCADSPKFDACWSL